METTVGGGAVNAHVDIAAANLSRDMFEAADAAATRNLTAANATTSTKAGKLCPAYRGQVIYWVKGSLQVLFRNLHYIVVRWRKGRGGDANFKTAHRTFDIINIMVLLMSK